ncbi:MAG: hypothetical protein MI784_06755 [Cytophagales bacterium]|nr:hypothetical protein [Cytophagales bacterium]
MGTKYELTGRWKFEENFPKGIAKGILNLEQEGKVLKGTLVMNEYIKEDKPFTIEEELTGKYKKDKIFLKGVSYKILNSVSPIEYELDHWEGRITNENLIIGSSYDGQKVACSFTLERIL